MRIETDESNLGNLIADAIRWYINKNACDFADKDNKIAFSVVSNGVIRNDIIKVNPEKLLYAMRLEQSRSALVLMEPWAILW